MPKPAQTSGRDGVQSTVARCSHREVHDERSPHSEVHSGQRECSVRTRRTVCGGGGGAGRFRSTATRRSSLLSKIYGGHVAEVHVPVDGDRPHAIVAGRVLVSRKGEQQQ